MHQNIACKCIRSSSSETSLVWREARCGKDFVIVAPDSVLRDTVYARRLAIALANLKISRRRVPDWLADTLYFHEGRLLWPCGKPFILGDNAIDESFGEEDSCWWFGAFRRFADRSMKQRPQARIVPRLRLLDAAFWIAYPDIARNFARKR